LKKPIGRVTSRTVETSPRFILLGIKRNPTEEEFALIKNSGRSKQQEKF
jgi:hypothetical protein